MLLRHPSTSLIYLRARGRGGRAAHRAIVPRVSTPARAGAGAAGADGLHPDIRTTLFSEEELRDAVARLGREIGNEYAGKNLLLVGVLKGCYMFHADLARAITPEPAVFEIDFLKASSYLPGALETSGKVTIAEGFDMSNVAGKHVLVVEDIIDSGLTLTAITELLRTEGRAASVKVVTLLDKRARRKVAFDADFVGFDCPDEFVVGYGIDYSERFRFLPYIGTPTQVAIDRIAAEYKAMHEADESFAFQSDDPME